MSSDCIKRFMCRVIVEELEFNLEREDVSIFSEGETFGLNFPMVETKDEAIKMANEIYNPFVKVTVKNGCVIDEYWKHPNLQLEIDDLDADDEAT